MYAEVMCCLIRKHNYLFCKYKRNKMKFDLVFLSLQFLAVRTAAFQIPAGFRPPSITTAKNKRTKQWSRQELGIQRKNFNNFSIGSTATDKTENGSLSTSKSSNESDQTGFGFLSPPESSHIYPDTPSFRDCLSFALPALGIYACPPLMSLIDASFIGRSSSVELAALGPASSISDSAPLPLLFLSIASTNLIAKAFSQKDKATLVRVSRTALGMGAIGGVILAILLYTFANPLSVLYCGTSSAAVLAPPCTKYVAIRALALPFVVLSTIAQAISIGTKDTRTPMASVAMAGALNLFGDFILVKWLGQGIAGAAWATSLSQVLSAGLLLRVLKKRGFLKQQYEQQHALNGQRDARKEEENKTPATWQGGNNIQENVSTTETIQQLLSFIPFLFVMSVKIFWHNSCAATAASLGGAKAAAHTALLSVAMLCFLLGDAGSSLAQAFLPAFLQTQGATTNGDEEIHAATFDLDAAMPTIKQLLKCTLSISTAAVCLASVIIGIFGSQITGDPAVLSEMRKTLPWIVTALSFHGSAVTLEGLLLVRKKFRVLSLCYTTLALTVAGFQLATKQFNLGLAGVWGCYIWFCASRVLTFSAIGGLLRPGRLFQRIREGVTILLRSSKLIPKVRTT
jgi:Na+-driven multidrug efflux pump